MLKSPFSDTVVKIDFNRFNIIRMECTPNVTRFRPWRLYR